MAQGYLKAFISYSHHDRRLAGELKQGLVRFGLDVFLAHDDIRPAAKWVRVIAARVVACDVFLAPLTEHFAASDWTDQETGMALATDKLIIPLKVDTNPYGFLGSIQALKVLPG
jgi:hypothetical protein